LMTLYIWSAVDVDLRELLAMEASYGRSSLNALKMCTNKPLVIGGHGIDGCLRG
jgi:hypothetical protein